MAIRSLLRSQITNAEWYDNFLAGNRAFVSGVAGYVTGRTSTTANNEVERFAFPSDTRTILATGLSSSRMFTTGMSNPSVAGYVVGGDLDLDTASDYVDTVDKFAFPAETRTTLGTGLREGLRGVTGFSNPEVAGYAAGGNPNSGSNQVSNVDKFAFPTDSRSSTTSLSTAKRFGAGFSNPAVAGYFAGGDTGSQTSNVEKFAFPSDSRSTLATGLSIARDAAAGFADPETAGYAAGGRSTDTDAVDKFAFPSDTRSTLGTGLSSVTFFAGGFSNARLAGYVAGGDDGSSVLSKVDKFAFPTDTRSSTTTLSVAKAQNGAFQDA